MILFKTIPSRPYTFSLSIFIWFSCSPYQFFIIFKLFFLIRISELNKFLCNLSTNWTSIPHIRLWWHMFDHITTLLADAKVSTRHNDSIFWLFVTNYAIFAVLTQSIFVGHTRVTNLRLRRLHCVDLIAVEDIILAKSRILLLFNFERTLIQVGKFKIGHLFHVKTALIFIYIWFCFLCVKNIWSMKGSGQVSS